MINHANQCERFYEYTKEILDEENFQGLKKLVHHGLNRYDHSLRVAKISYHICASLRLNEKAVARGALLHDFFFEDNQELKRKEKLKTLVNHPEYALKTAKEKFNLTEVEEDIIVSHMFPVGKHIPKYLESWIVDFIDDIVSIYERYYGFEKQISFATSFLFLLILNYLR